MKGYVSGVFDLFHVGHLDVLRQASQSCDRLAVGVLTDDWAAANLGDRPYVPLVEREQIVSRLRYVDEVVVTDGTSRDVLSALGVDIVFVADGLDFETAVHPSAGGLSVVPLEVRRTTDSPVLRATLGRRQARASVA